MATVSLIIPCHNNATTIDRAIRSGQRQAFLHEIIVVDDQSADRSPELVAKLAAHDPRIRLIQTEHNVGAGAARNVGASSASGSHVCFLDADDEILGDLFRDALALLANEPGMRAVKPDEEFVDPIKGYILPPGDIRHDVAVLSSVHGLVIERNAFKMIGGFPEDQAFRGPLSGEDVAFMQAVIEHCQPLGRLAYSAYRVWSQHGSHLDRFLGNTRLKDDGFEFVRLHQDQAPEGCLAKAMVAYLTEVRQTIAACGNGNAVMHYTNEQAEKTS